MFQGCRPEENCSFKGLTFIWEVYVGHHTPDATTAGVVVRVIGLRSNTFSIVHTLYLIARVYGTTDTVHFIRSAL